MERKHGNRTTRGLRKARMRSIKQQRKVWAGYGCTVQSPIPGMEADMAMAALFGFRRRRSA